MAVHPPNLWDTNPSPSRDDSGLQALHENIPHSLKSMPNPSSFLVTGLSITTCNKPPVLSPATPSCNTPRVPESHTFPYTPRLPQDHTFSLANIPTIVFIRALWVAVDRTGLTMGSPTGMRNSKVYIKLDVKIHVLLFCRQKWEKFNMEGCLYPKDNTRISSDLLGPPSANLTEH